MQDSQVFEDQIDEHNSSADTWADSAYYSGDRQQALKEAGYCSRIHRKGTRRRKLNDREQKANCKRPKLRARVEHVFAQQTDRLVRPIGLARAATKIGLMNLVHNMRRYAYLVG